MSIYRSFIKVFFLPVFLLSGCLAGQNPDLDLPRAREDSIRSIIAYLASDELEGRDVGTTGLQQAEGYIIGRFLFLNLVPAGDNTSFVQSFPYTITRRTSFITTRQEVQLHNVIAKIPGHGSNSDEYILLMAHYDHIGQGGMGRSASRADGEIHNGADDNASGTAALVELARIFSEKPVNNRSILFLATCGEEEGDLGSKAWIKNPTVPLNAIKAVINFDMVGRLRNNQVALIASKTSPAFEHLQSDLKNPNRLEILNLYPFGGTPDDLTTFHRVGIPGVEFWTGYHADYHAPSDDLEKINIQGESWIVDLAAQAVLLIDQIPAKSLTFSGAAPVSQPSTNPAATQPVLSRVVIGIRAAPRIIEGFYGVQIGEVTPNSPADAAGIQAGDALLQINKRIIYNAQELIVILNELTPGMPVLVKIRRGDKTLDLVITPRLRDE
jgi:hypothetical protein